MRVLVLLISSLTAILLVHKKRQGKADTKAEAARKPTRVSLQESAEDLPPPYHQIKL